MTEAPVGMTEAEGAMMEAEAGMKEAEAAMTEEQRACLCETVPYPETFMASLCQTAPPSVKRLLPLETGLSPGNGSLNT
jgi:hypothetical protein